MLNVLIELVFSVSKLPFNQIPNFLWEFLGFDEPLRLSLKKTGLIMLKCY